MDINLTLIALALLILCSAFFSASETAMMSLNKYKLRHLAKRKNKAAKRSLNLIKRPDRLLGMILVGNTFANIIASAILTSYAEQSFGQIGLVVSTISLTIIILLFGEIIPKTLAAVFPEQLAFPASPILWLLLMLFYPLVWLLNSFVNILFRLCGLKIKHKETSEPLSSDEIHSVVHDSKSKLGPRNKNMLLGVLELNQIKVSDVMIPHHKVECINLSLDINNIIKQIVNAKHSILIACYDTIENIAGIILTREALKFITKDDTPTYEEILSLLNEPYYTPDNISIQTQLIDFQKKGMRFATVVNEYGEIEGIITVEDIIEEIVGEFADTYNLETHIKIGSDNTHTTTGDTTIREINRHLHLHLPTHGAKTISGFIIDELREIPIGNCCLKINDYVVEVKKVENNMIKLVKIRYIHHE
ncbi:HlyC/CorC family transporter [Fastidiosibacter lacustris]|uniref:HlyC/CorC family transporter n=1 Tax=Fastidiosibacter lacustris TaxID=2056695 RepID=UPI000E3481D8|nr:CNNM domain-containing protein [Fastidiosibacter lacustris]